MQCWPALGMGCNALQPQGPGPQAGGPQAADCSLAAGSLEAGGRDGELAQAAILAANIGIPHSAHIIPEQLGGVVLLNLCILQSMGSAGQACVRQ